MAIVGVLALQALRRLGVKGVEIKKPEQLQNVTSLIIPGGESTTMAKLAEYHNLLLSGSQNAPPLNSILRSLGLAPVWNEWGGVLYPQWHSDTQVSVCYRIVGGCYGDEIISLDSHIFGNYQGEGQKIGGQQLVGGLDCTVHRNFFGSQIQSFEAEVLAPELASKEGGPETFRGVFIRAPAILEVGPEVQVLADYPVPSNSLLSLDPSIESAKENVEEQSKVIVAVRQGNILATAFHPELTADTRWHSYFIKMANENEEEASSSIVPIEVNISYNQKQLSDLPVFQ
ncbi:hypothetical protein TanjilG_10337 [Lupinus angustifolius]|uniref:glutaminase n=1 Tax=Lupinus angustifolius TaxID=3871 RepID=A0A4P1R475_LUPAN|nr:hypothetical protein TanjilG_10337 [Lupinus angustifolius]